MSKDNFIIREERMIGIIGALQQAQDLATSKKVQVLTEYLCLKVQRTNKCYRIELYELPSHDVINENELLVFKELLIPSLKKAGLKAEEEEEDLIKVECLKKLHPKELPTLSDLQSKVLKLYEIKENADELVKKLVENNKLTHHEYEELQLVRHYEI